jgi:hypothetical protein
VASARIAKRSNESSSVNGRVVMAVMSPMVALTHCQIDARRCQLLPTPGQRLD